jgi:chromosome segregation ATPase
MDEEASINMSKEVADVAQAAQEVENRILDLQNKLLGHQGQNTELKSELAASNSEREQLRQALVTSEGEVQKLQNADASVAQQELSRLYAALGVDPTQPIQAIHDRLHVLGVPGY